MEKKIKVLHIITRLIAGGADENTIYTVNGLDQKLYKIDLIVGCDSEQERIHSIQNARVIHLPYLVRQISPINDIMTFCSLVKIIRGQRYHIIHTHTAKAGILGRLAGKFCQVPIIVHTLHGTTFHNSLNPVTYQLYRFLERCAAKITTNIITVGNDLRKKYLKAKIGKPENYLTIRSGFDLERFLLTEKDIANRNRVIRKKLGLKKTDFVIGSASRMEPRKGQKYLLQAAGEIVQKDSSVKFLLAGHGSQLNEHKYSIHENGLQEDVLLIGHRTDIDHVMCVMDVFVLTSLWEGLPRVLVQSAALGIPIITFNIEGAREVVDDGVNGFIVPLKDTQKLSDRISLFVSDHRLAKQMGAKGRLKVSREWDKKVMVNRISELYMSLMKNRLM